jgi:hypothetical protein
MIIYMTVCLSPTPPHTPPSDDGDNDGDGPNKLPGCCCCFFIFNNPFPYCIFFLTISFSPFSFPCAFRWERFPPLCQKKSKHKIIKLRVDVTSRRIRHTYTHKDDETFVERGFVTCPTFREQQANKYFKKKKMKSSLVHAKFHSNIAEAPTCQILLRR